MFLNLRQLVLVTTFSVAVIGCGSSGEPDLRIIPEVTGKVLLPKGVPLKGGTLLLRPAGGLRPAVSAAINSDGSFTIDGTLAMKPVVSGDYQVYVVFDKEDKHRNLRSQVPKKYQRVSDDESDLYVTIDEGSTELVVKLRRG